MSLARRRGPDKIKPFKREIERIGPSKLEGVVWLPLNIDANYFSTGERRMKAHPGTPPTTKKVEQSHDFTPVKSETGGVVCSALCYRLTRQPAAIDSTLHITLVYGVSKPIVRFSYQ